MGGNNTKQAVSEWNNYRTSEQSSAIPYEAQIHTKYKNNNNINELINNLHTTEKSYVNDDIFTKLLNNTSSYNTKYQNKPDTTVHASAQDAYESPFLSPAKYANLLNSDTFDNAQHGGARLPNTHKTPTKAKKPKKSKTPKSKPEPEPETESETEPEPKPEPPTSSTDSDHDNTQKSDETTDEDLNKSDDEDLNKSDDEVSEGASTSESHNNKYESPSSVSNSVHTSQINMLDSYS
jgi:outer membrane biosynthesis protein TonB